MDIEALIKKLKHENDLELQSFSDLNKIKIAYRELQDRLRAADEQVKQLTHERQRLAEAIGEIAVACGDKRTDFAGPDLLMVCCDAAEIMKQLETDRDHYRQQVEAAKGQEADYILDYEYDEGHEDPDLGGDLIFHSLNGKEYPVGTKLYALPPIAAEEVQACPECEHVAKLLIGLAQVERGEFIKVPDTINTSEEFFEWLQSHPEPKQGEPIAWEATTEVYIMGIRCWWLGHEKHPDDYDPEHAQCIHCGDHVSYADLVGDTRHNRFKEWCNYYFFRKWWSAKCSSCGHRFKHDESNEHIPF